MYKRIERELNNTVAVKYDVYEKELFVKIDMLKDELLDIEIKLQDALIKARKEFLDKENEIVSEMSELTQGFI